MDASLLRSLHGPESLRPLFAPTCIAVVGVSTRESSFGARVWKNTSTFVGQRFAVNPRYREIAGERCYAELADLPCVPDCVLLALPRESCEAALEACARLGVRSAVMLASGYAETGLPERIEDQRRLQALARRTGLRLLGPNCMGYFHAALRLGMTFAPRIPQAIPGAAAIGLISQSGAIGFALADGAERGRNSRTS